MSSFEGSIFIPVCTENLDSDVFMMQSADQRMRHDASDPLNRARERRIFGQGAVRSGGVVIARVRFYDLAQMSLAQCDDVVNTFATDRSNQPLSKGVLPRRSWRNGLVADAHST